MVRGSVKLSDGCWTSCPPVKPIPSFPPGERIGLGVSTRRVGPRPSSIVCSPKPEELIVDDTEKYLGGCSVNCLATSGRPFEGGVVVLSPSVVCAGYRNISLRSIKGRRSLTTFTGWKNLVCNSRYAVDENPLPQSYSWQ